MEVWEILGFRQKPGGLRLLHSGSRVAEEGTLWILQSLPRVLKDFEGQLLSWDQSLGSDFRDREEGRVGGAPLGQDLRLGRNGVFLEMRCFQEVEGSLKTQAGVKCPMLRGLDAAQEEDSGLSFWCAAQGS